MNGTIGIRSFGTIGLALACGCGSPAPDLSDDMDVACLAFRCDAPGANEACCGDKPIDDGPPAEESGTGVVSPSTSSEGTTTMPAVLTASSSGGETGDAHSASSGGVTDTGVETSASDTDTSTTAGSDDPGTEDATMSAGSGSSETASSGGSSSTSATTGSGSSTG